MSGKESKSIETSTASPGTASPKSAPPGITLRDVWLTAGDKVLLNDVDADFHHGQITLIVGPSGVGKSLLMKIVAGIVEASERGIRYGGEIEINGQAAMAGKVGFVFQSFALFDEWSPTNNVSFARSAGGDHAAKQEPQELLQRLNVPTDVPTSRLSGGQKQRLAIARTLSYNSPVIVYDEPTSGLDPATGRQVANLIRETHEEYQKTTLVVTHDYVSLLPIADRIFLLDPSAKRLIDVPSEQWDTIATILKQMTTGNSDDDAAPRQYGWRNFKSDVYDFFVNTSNWVTAVLIGLFSMLPMAGSPAWGLKFFGHYCRLIFGPTALIYLVLSGIISGFVTTYFTFKFLPFASYTEPLLIEDLLTGLGFAMYRIFVPVLGCVLIAARCGAAVTSDIGSRQYGSQLAAMRTLGTSPRAYLLTPIIWAFLIGTPILYFASYFGARMTSLVTFVNSYPERGPDFWHQYFHRGLFQPASPWYRGTHWLLAKLITSGFGIALISYYIGRRPKYSSADVSRSVTKTILLATLYVLIVHFIFSLFEFEGIVPGAN